MKLCIAIVFISAMALAVSSELTPAGELPPCLMDLLPCVDFLQDKNLKPTPQCCLPLKKTIDTDQACLCKMIDDAKLIAAFNLTRDTIINFPPSCGLAKTDPAKDCAGTSGATPASGGAVPSTPAASGGEVPSTPVAASTTPAAPTTTATAPPSSAGVTNTMASLVTLIASGAVLVNSLA